MGVTIVVGGQYGSEAKAKGAIIVGKEYLADDPMSPLIGVRCGGPNAGHTVFFGEEGQGKYVLRHVPSLSVIPEAKLVISAGSMVNLDLLYKEIADIESMDVSISDRLVVDRQAVVVEGRMIEQEKALNLGTGVGSTQTGTGSTASERCLRNAFTIKAWSDENGVDVMNCDTFNIMHDTSNNIVIEGTQGFGLSMYHSGHYPFCTSKDTTASAFASEAGIAPTDVDEVVMVIRTYPILVGGNSGYMKDEISWDEVKKRCGATEDLIEMTSVTKKVRRVGEFDWELLIRAIQANKPARVMVHGADYLDWSCRGVRHRNQLTDTVFDWIDKLDEFLHKENRSFVSHLFTGPLQEDVVEL